MLKGSKHPHASSPQKAPIDGTQSAPGRLERHELKPIGFFPTNSKRSRLFLSDRWRAKVLPSVKGNKKRRTKTMKRSSTCFLMKEVLGFGHLWFLNSLEIWSRTSLTQRHVESSSALRLRLVGTCVIKAPLSHWVSEMSWHTVITQQEIAGRTGPSPHLSLHDVTLAPHARCSLLQLPRQLRAASPVESGHEARPRGRHDGRTAATPARDEEMSPMRDDAGRCVPMRGVVSANAQQ